MEIVQDFGTYSTLEFVHMLNPNGCVNGEFTCCVLYLNRFEKRPVKDCTESNVIVILIING